jgi:peptidyl-prolyl cis-trans isomerase A (cyclophilin A)|tara:strand:+ start:1674 stop:2243 length:570 start_codon:yes stop_codon:yes gene_type:complete
MYKKIPIIFVVILLALPCYAEKNPLQVSLTTNLGEMLLELYPESSPVTVKNFLIYVESKYYNGLIFHRVINRFMIQAGGFNEDLTRMNPTEKSIKNESSNGLKNKKFTVAMARTQDPDSAKAQFFINVADNESLDAQSGKPGYAVFGKVIGGMSIAEKISKLPTQRVSGMADVPTATVKIIQARIITDR